MSLLVCQFLALPAITTAQNAQPRSAPAQASLVECVTLNPLPSGQTCEVTHSGDTSKLLLGTVLVPGAIYHGGQVAIDKSGTIVCVGCDCMAEVPGATTIVCPTGVISPGLINTHDHITFTQNSPADDTQERYEHRHQWREEVQPSPQGHDKIIVKSIYQVPMSTSVRRDTVRWGELRFLLTGTTSTSGRGGEQGFLRNLDESELEESLKQLAVTNSVFPLGDNDGALLIGSCAYPSIDSAPRGPYEAHVAEGTNLYAHNELACLSSPAGGGKDLVLTRSTFVHAIPATAEDLALLAEGGTALSWSPRSNIRLYGDTAYVSAADRLGVQIALGTDWTATGSMNLLRELQCADHWNQQRLNHYFSDEQLWLMATANAAAAFGMEDAIGVLAAGRAADVVVFNATVHPDHRAVIDATPKDVVLVMRGGRVLYGDASFVGQIPRPPARNDISETLSVCGVAKRLYAAGEINKTLSALRANLGNPPVVGDRAAPGSTYPAVFCQTPANEPACDPERIPVAKNGFLNFFPHYTGEILAGVDSDGDGIEDGNDDCPLVFNPIRPMRRTQTDSDQDGVGDPCDPCPLDADNGC